MSCTRPMLSV